MTEATGSKPSGAENVVWDLSVFYDRIDDPKIEQDLQEVSRMAQDFADRYRGHVAELSADEMRQAYQQLEAIYDKAGEIGSYASLNYTVYSTDPTWGALMQKVDERLSRMRQSLVFFALEANRIDDERASQLMQDEMMRDYAYHLEASRLEKDYQLSEDQEKIILQKDVTGNNAWVRLFSQIMAGMTFDWDGETLNQPQLLKKMFDEDRDVRRQAADKMTEALHDRSMELTFIFNVLAGDKATEDELRGYPSWITSRNLANKAPEAVVEALVETVTSNYDLVSRHYDIKRRLLGIDTLRDYDRYAPLNLKDSETEYTWEQARDIVLNAYEKFSPQMAQMARQFFDNNWIHAPAMQGKRGGAYASYGTRSTHPFVFVNFTGTARDVATLAHELGHGVHMYAAAQNQTLFSMYTPLTTAEMASTFGEMLVFQDLMSREEDDEVRLSMLVSKIEDSFSTIFRQVSMNRFENAMHTARREEGELSTDRLSELWIETQRAMYGDSVDLRDEYRAWWSYIPHFLHTPGYVYAYAFGELLVLALYNLYQQEGESFIPRYLDLLASGDSDYPDRLLAKVGVDLNDPGFWQQGIDALRQLVDREEELARSLYPDRFA